MKQLINLFIPALMACMIFTACQNPGSALTDSQRAVIEKQILEQWDKVNAAVERADADGYTAFLSSNEFLAMHSQGTQFLPVKQYTDSVKVWFSPRKSVEVKQKNVRVNVLSENLVLLDQTSIFQPIFKDNRVMRLNHAVSFIFKKEPSGWKIVHGHESWYNL